MVTHENDIAEFARRNIVFKDGAIITNKIVENRRNATLELQQLKSAHPDD